MKKNMMLMICLFVMVSLAMAQTSNEDFSTYRIYPSIR